MGHPPKIRKPYALRMAGDARPRYRQIADDIAALIASGRYELHSRMPGRAKLAKEHGVSIGTIEQALKSLAADGMVQAVHGSGTYVTAKKPQRVKTDGEKIADLQLEVASLRDRLDRLEARRQ